MTNPRVSIVTPSIRPEGLERVAEGLRIQTLRDFEWLTEINVSGVVDFNTAMNRMIRRAKGELIVSLQDFIKIEKDGLQKFWDAYENEPAFYTAPVGKVQYDMLDLEPKWDWRVERDTAGWQEWEIDCGAAPRDYLYNIGGFDEELDKAWGFDNCDIGLRAKLAGYKFYCLKDNKAIAVDHDAIIEHPFRKLRDPEMYNQRLDEIKRGIVKVEYLN